MKVGIRVDASSDIGLGHVMRCLGLAETFRKRGHEVIFFSIYKLGIDKILDGNFRVEEVIEDEIEFLNKRFNQEKMDLLIVDKYDVSFGYFQRLKKIGIKTVYIDDLNKEEYSVEFIINGNVTGDLYNYESYYKKEQLIVGLKYNMLREGFTKNQRNETLNEVKTVVITTGGSDQNEIAEIFANYMVMDYDLKNLDINILVGPGYEESYISRLIEFANKYEQVQLVANSKNILLYKNIKKVCIIELMKKADIVISASGSTTYELCSLGVPSIIYIDSYDQENIYQYFVEKGCMKGLGYKSDIEKKQFTAMLKMIINNKDLRENMSKKMAEVVDGKGNERIVKFLEMYL